MPAPTPNKPNWARPQPTWVTRTSVITMQAFAGRDEDPRTFKSFDIIIAGCNPTDFTNSERQFREQRWAILYPYHKPNWVTLRSIEHIDRRPRPTYTRTPTNN